MPDEMTAPQEPTKKGKPMIWLGVVLALIIAGLAFWQLSQKGEGPAFSPQPTDIAETPEQIAWKTYSNQNYSVKYPEKWSVDAPSAEEIILSSHQNLLVQLESQSPPADLMSMMISVHQVSSQTTVDQFIKDQKYLTPLSQAPVAFNGLQGQQLLYTFPRDNTEALNIITVLKQNAKMFVFSYNSFKPEKERLPDTTETVHDEMLKSFSVAK